MAENKKQVIDITLLGVYDTEIKAVITAKETTINNTIGALPEGYADVVSYIAAKVAEVTGAAGDLEERVAANELAIGHKAEGEKAATGLYLYTDNAAKKAVDDIINGATTDFDTLKEVEQWILNDQSGAAKMQIDIAALQGTEADDETAVSIVGVKKYADAAVAGKNVSAAGETGEDALVEAGAAANKVTVNATKKLKGAVALAETSVQTVTKGVSTETYVSVSVVDGADATVALDDSALVSKLGAAKTASAAASGMYADIQGATNATIEDVNNKIDSFELAAESQILALFGK